MTDNRGASSSTSQQIKISSVHQFAANVTADGRKDAVVYFADSGVWYVAPATGNGDPTTWKWRNIGAGPSKQMLADVTGDGKADAIVMFPGSGNWYVAPSTGAGFTRDPATWQWTDTFGLGS